MPSEKPSRRVETAGSASRCAPFSIFHVPLPNMDGKKFIVVAFHVEEHGAAMCMKATSQVELYKNNPEMMAGAVLCPVGSVKCFSKETVIQPNNLFALTHEQLDTDGELVGVMPPEFIDQLETAVKKSLTLSEPKRRRILAELAKIRAN